MSNRIVVIGEAQGDFEVARELIDQSILRCVELTWIKEDVDLEHHRIYRGFEQSQEFVVWGWLDTTNTKDYRIRSRGMFENDWPSHDVALRIQRAIFHFVNDAEFIVVVKDTDGNELHETQLRSVRELVEKMPVVVGIEHTKLECWLVAGFNPQNPTEEERLQTLCLGEKPGIGFNPCLRSHELTATGPASKGDPRNAKRVLEFLVGDDWRVALRSLHRDNHPILSARGEHNGLADFLSDIRERLIRVVFGV